MISLFDCVSCMNHASLSRQQSHKGAWSRGFATHSLAKVKVYDENTPTCELEDSSSQKSPICSYNEWDPLEVNQK